jgi:hypothetical protein
MIWLLIPAAEALVFLTGFERFLIAENFSQRSFFQTRALEIDNDGGKAYRLL